MQEPGPSQITIPPGLPVTPAQLSFVRSLQRGLHLPDRMLENYCTSHFGHAFEALDRAQMSALIDELKGWQDIPAQLQREMGQRDLPGFGGS